MNLIIQISENKSQGKKDNRLSIKSCCVKRSELSGQKVYVGLMIAIHCETFSIFFLYYYF